MKTIPLPDNFPVPQYQLGQVVRVLQAEAMSNFNTPILGLVVGLRWINPENSRIIGYASGWGYMLSFVDMPGLPEGFGRNLIEPSDWACEADLEPAQ